MTPPPKTSDFLCWAFLFRSDTSGRSVGCSFMWQFSFITSLLEVCAQFIVAVDQKQFQNNFIPFWTVTFPFYLYWTFLFMVFVFWHFFKCYCFYFHQAVDYFSINGYLCLRCCEFIIPPRVGFDCSNYELLLCLICWSSVNQNLNENLSQDTVHTMSMTWWYVQSFSCCHQLLPCIKAPRKKTWEM